MGKKYTKWYNLMLTSVVTNCFLLWQKQTKKPKKKNPDACLTTRCQQCSNVQVRAASAVTDILLMTAGTMGIYRDFMVAPLDVSVF